MLTHVRSLVEGSDTMKVVPWEPFANASISGTEPSYSDAREYFSRNKDARYYETEVRVSLLKHLWCYFVGHKWGIKSYDRNSIIPRVYCTYCKVVKTAKDYL